MKKILFFILFLCSLSFIDAQQISIPRIEKMSNLPAPYVMRNWKQVAIDYDNFIFDSSRTGSYLPITTVSTANGINYPGVNPIRMDTYIGQLNHGNVAEAINILPAIVGASLVGIDKTTHLNTNWVLKTKDFFNLKNGQNVYLNDYSSTTGSDWWYEIMPNVFFYQLYALYPQADADFDYQFTAIANRELGMLYQLGGTFQPWKIPSMNYRAFDLITGLPNTSGVPEPEAAGSVAWILYQAYSHTNNKKYLQGAELALDFLLNRTTNPSYEIQLPYGIAAAARMNALEGTNYDIEKMMNWTFSSGIGTLRGWGCITGNWSGYDVSGLIGEANDAGDDYAFCMNGFQHAAALAPVAKYDKRFARAIGKWILNLANASRLFYTNALPPANQEPASYTWANQYDLNACIPYESMKEIWNGIQPFAMGDAFVGGWAATDLSIYSGSSVGYLAAIIEKSNVDGILQIDLNKTDFRGTNTYPNYLYYNPATVSQSIDVTLPTGYYDVYDAITETVLKKNVTGITSFSIGPDSVRLLVFYPTAKVTEVKGRLKLVDGNIIDFHSNNDFSNALRIKVFSISDTIVQIANSLDAYCLTENNGSGNLTYKWYQNDVKIATGTIPGYSWKAPDTPGIYSLKCVVSENLDSVSSDPVSIRVVEKLIVKPVITDILFSANIPFNINSSLTAAATINTSDAQYSWSCSEGTLNNYNTAVPTWNIPVSPGIYFISVTAANDAGSSVFSKSVLVKDFSVTQEPMPLIYYPLNGDTKNYARDAFHAASLNTVFSTGANGIADAACQFLSDGAYLYTPNDPALNFQDKIAVSFWVKPEALPSVEQFIISHGSWEERYKVSITPEKKVRWTVKTTNSVVDVDADSMLQVGKFDHFAAIYTGYSLELYRNGLLSGFKVLTGPIKTTAKSITIARKDEGTGDYNFKGTIDEVRIYNSDLSQQFIQILPSTFTLLSGIHDISAGSIKIFPNPFSGELNLRLPQNEKIAEIGVYNILGECIYHATEANTGFRFNAPAGLYFVKIRTLSGIHYAEKVIKN